MPATREYVTKEYPHTPIYEKGAIVKEFDDHITDIGVHGKPQRILPFIQSKIEKKIMIKKLLCSKLFFLLSLFII